MAKLQVEGDILRIQCPGCQEVHTVDLTSNRRWKWNGDANSPTIFPTVHTIEGDRRCHAFVAHGKWNYLSTSTHGLAGQVIEVPAFPQN